MIRFGLALAGLKLAGYAPFLGWRDVALWTLIFGAACFAADLVIDFVRGLWQGIGSTRRQRLVSETYRDALKAVAGEARLLQTAEGQRRADHKMLDAAERAVAHLGSKIH